MRWQNAFLNSKPLSNNLHQLLKEPIEKTKPHRKLTAEEARRLAKLQALADKLRRGENVQNSQLKKWLSEN